jgi:FeS assembly SUF system protein
MFDLRKLFGDKPAETNANPGTETAPQGHYGLPQGKDALNARVVEVLRSIYDPEIPVNIYDLGLIYSIEITPGIENTQACVDIRMTLTAPNCPVAQSFPQTVEDAVLTIPEIREAHVELVWEPPWSREHMSDAAKLQLGLL